MSQNRIEILALALALVPASTGCGSSPSDDGDGSSAITPSTDHANFDVTWKPDTIVAAVEGKGKCLAVDGAVTPYFGGELKLFSLSVGKEIAGKKLLSESSRSGECPAE